MTTCYLIIDYQIYLSTKILGVRYVKFLDFVKQKRENEEKQQ